MSFKTISAILRGTWLLDKGYASSYLPAVYALLEGKKVDFGYNDVKGFDDDGGEEKKDRTPQVKMRTVAGSAYNIYPYSDLTRLPQDSIAVVPIVGPVMKYSDWCSYGMVDIATLITRLADAGNISGIILDIDSPGGQVDGTATLADSILRARQKKPIIAAINDGMAASAAMWIASAAQEIYCSQVTDRVGSIGVYTTIADWYGHYKNYFQLNVKDVYAPQSTEKNLQYIQSIEGNDDLLKEDLSVVADQFHKTIIRNRKGKLTGDEWKAGKLFKANDAKRIGLIDGMRSFEQVIARMNQLTKR